MRFFKKTEYIDEVIPEITGSKGGLAVTLKNMPVRREAATSKLKFRYTDLSVDIDDALSEKGLVDFQRVKELSERGETFLATFRLRQRPELEMSVEIQGDIPADKDWFYEHLLDAIIDAWEKSGIKR